MSSLLTTDIPLEERVIYTTNSSNKVIQFNDRTYYRYMDRFYTCSQPSEMEREEVALLSTLRIQKDDAVIDYQYTKSIIKHLLSFSSEREEPLDIVDFGCGNGILSSVLKENNTNVSSILGLDLSKDATMLAEQVYRNNLPNSSISTKQFYKNDILTERGESKDVILSSFVMHFPVFESQIKELYRVLKPSGVFVYNDYIYNRQPAHYLKVLNILKRVGFICEESTFSLTSSYSNKVGYHKVIKCSKK